MKKIFNIATAVLAFAALTSCASEMSPEEIQAKAKEKFEADKTELQAAAEAECDNNTAMYIQNSKDSLMRITQ